MFAVIRVVIDEALSGTIVAFVSDVFKRADCQSVELVNERMKLIHVTTQFLADLFVGRRTAESLPQILIDLRQILALLSKRARCPVQLTQAVQHRASNSQFRVSLELDTPFGFEFVHCVKKPDDTRINEVADLDVGRQTNGYPMGDVIDHRQRFVDQIVSFDRRHTQFLLCISHHLIPGLNSHVQRIGTMSRASSDPFGSNKSSGTCCPSVI